MLLMNVVARLESFQRTTEADKKALPLTVRLNCAPPAVALLGEIEVIVCGEVVIAKVTVFDTGPTPSALLQLQMLTPTLPALAITVAGILAVSWSPLGDTELTLQQAPNCSTDPWDKKPLSWDEKPLPLTVSVKLAPPAFALLGEIEVIVGTVFPFPPPPPP